MIAHRVRHYHTMNFIRQYLMNSGENSVGAHAGADTVCLSKCGTCLTCVRMTLEGWVAGTEVSNIGAGAAAPWHMEWCMPRCVDTWRQTMMMHGYKCRDMWIVWGGWQMWEEGWDAGNMWRWGIRMCLVQGITLTLVLQSGQNTCASSTTNSECFSGSWDINQHVDPGVCVIEFPYWCHACHDPMIWCVSTVRLPSFKFLGVPFWMRGSIIASQVPNHVTCMWHTKKN